MKFFRSSSLPLNFKNAAWLAAVASVVWSLPLSSILDIRYNGEFTHFLFVLYFRAVFQDQHIVVIVV